MDKITTICFKLTKEEKKQLKLLAKANHLSVSAYIRYKCLNIILKKEK